MFHFEEAWNLRQEIKLFVEIRHQNVSFLSDENWLNDLQFLTGIALHLLEMNLKQQRKSQLVSKLFDHICDLEKKLGLFQVQLGKTTLSHLTCLEARKMGFPDLDSNNYAASVQELRYEFTRRLMKFRRDDIKVKLFAHHFDLQWKTVLTIVKWNSLNYKLTRTTRGNILKIVWWTFANSMLIESFQICPVVQEE